MNLIDDLSKITSIPRANLEELVQKSMIILAHDMCQSELINEDLLKVEIGIGDLLIKKQDNELLFKFIPTKKLQNMLVDSVNDKKDPLIERAETSLRDRVMSVYKELL